MEIQNNPEQMGDWQRLYLDTRAFWRGWRQLLLVGVPLLLTAFWVAFAILYLFPQFISRWTSLLWLVLLLIVVWLVGVLFLFNTAQTFILKLYRPSAEADVSSQIWHRLMGWQGIFAFRNYILVNDTKLKPPDHWGTWLGGPAYLIVYDGFAVYLERGNCFSRVVGAGFPIPYLDARETIKAIVDLRPQIREAGVNSWTKDGIRVEMKMRAEYQIYAATADTKLMYPFDPLAVKKAVEYSTLRFREGKFVDSDWCDGTMGKITGLLSRYISSHHLDELFLMTDENNVLEAQLFSEKVMKKLYDETNTGLMKDVGVSLKGIQIIDIKFPDDVRRQRLDTRDAEKGGLIARIQGEAQAYRIRVSEDARAMSQRDLIVAIAKGLDKIEPADFPEPLLLTLSGLIDQGLEDPFVRSYLGKETLTTIERLRKMI